MRGGLGVNFRSYLIVLACIALPATLVEFFWPVIGITGCHGEGYQDDLYIAYCDSTGYGDYEHGALYFDLEPEAIRSLRAADILLVGDSRSQAAFSTHPTDAFAMAHGWRIYRFGFGYYEDSAFIMRLIRRYRLRPRMIIVNADPFFTDEGSALSRPLLSGPDRQFLYMHQLIKRLAQDMQRATCGAHILTRLTCGNARTLYRSRIDGSLDLRYMADPRRFPVVIDPTYDLEMAPHVIEVARQFLVATGLGPDCLLLTVVPSNFATPLLAQQVARSIGLPLVLAPADGLYTTDQSHLRPDSAERWTALFFENAERQIEACMATTTARPNSP